MFKRTIFFGSILTSVLLACIAFQGGMAASTTVESKWALTEPSIDGTFTTEEWNDAEHVSFNHTTPVPPHAPDFVHFYFKNTANKLFILIDDLPDNTSDEFDYLGIDFDANLDGTIDDNISMGCFANESLAGPYPGNGMMDCEFGFGGSPNKAENHTIIEIVITINASVVYNGVSNGTELGNALPVGTTNGTISIQLTAAPPVCGWSFPQDSKPWNATTFAMLFIAEKPASIPGYMPGLLLVTVIATASIPLLRSRILKKTP